MSAVALRPNQYSRTEPVLSISDWFISQTAKKYFTIRGKQFIKQGEAVYTFHPLTGQVVEIDPQQLWFWTPEWQADERRVDEELRAGLYEEFDNIDEFVATL